MVCFNYINLELCKSKNFNSVSKCLNKSLRHTGSLVRKHLLETKERGISETEELALHDDHRDLFPLERHGLNDCPLEEHGVNS